MKELNLKIAEPVFLRNLVLYPIKNGSDDEPINLTTIDEVLNNKKGAFSELEIPSVNEIVFDNRGDLPVLMIDGEEITGSLQNRIIARSSIVEARSSNRIPVICAEERRWQELGGFKTGYCSYPKIRSILATSLHKKINTQRMIWNEITRKLTVTRTQSQTSSMHEIFENLEDEIARYLEGFDGLNHDTVGFIGVAGNRILGADIFTYPRVYNRFEQKLLRSYVLDAIEYQRPQTRKPDVKAYFHDLLSAIAKADTKNKHIKLKGKHFLGQMVIYKDRPLHISAFPS